MKKHNRSNAFNCSTVQLSKRRAKNRAGEQIVESRKIKTYLRTCGQLLNSSPAQK